MSYPNPAFVKAGQLGLYNKNIPETFECFSVSKDGSRIIIPRGATQILALACKHGQQEVRFEDRRTHGDQIGVLPKVPLRDYQQEGVDLILRRTQGTIVLGCGGGKTRCGVAGISAINCTALVIVHTNDLVDQWHDTVKSLLGIRPGILNANHKDYDAQILIASVMSLVPTLQEFSRDPAMKEWRKRFGFVIVDEGHHAPATTHQVALSYLPAKWRLNLTATPERSDGHTRLMDWSFGPRLLMKDARDLVSEGFLMKPTMMFPETDFRWEWDGRPNDPRRISALNDAVMMDEDRNNLIADIATRDGAAGETVLVLSNRKEHCKILYRLIRERGGKVMMVTSATKKRERQQAIQDLRSGALRIMIATSLADEGLDVQRLSRIILAFPESGERGTIQRTGRLMRKFEGKIPVLYDICDPQQKTLAARAASRKRSYRKIGLL
jgi:superfamily II DNA or RNA helicase